MNINERPKDLEQIFFSDGHQLGTQLKIEEDITKLQRSTRELYYNVDQLIDSFVQRCQVNGIPVDCRMGCSWCCHQAVFASTHEIILMTQYLKKHYSIEVVEEVRKRAEAKEAQLGSLSPAETLKSRHACPLLLKGRCMVYPLRPMACRIYLSSSEESCLKRHQNPYDTKAIPALFDFTLKAGQQMNEGFGSALKKQGLSVEEHRIEHILLFLLNEPQKADLWLKGDTLHQSFPFDEAQKDQPGKA
jgi:Fe-S-cluster containining protein